MQAWEGFLRVPNAPSDSIHAERQAAKLEGLPRSIGCPEGIGLRTTRECYHGTALFDPAGSVTVARVIYEWGALAKALTIQRGC